MKTLEAPLSLEESVAIVAPLGQDAKLTATVLAKVGIQAEIIRNLKELCVRLGEPLGAVIIAEEAINADNFTLLKGRLRDQPPWSDIPILILTSNRKNIYGVSNFLGSFAIGGNVSILERPLGKLTLITAVQVAIRARKRQYLVRELFQQQIQSLKLRDDFLSIASHELKTPITSLKLQVQMRKRFIKRGDPSVYSPEKVNALIETTEHQINRLSRLVDDMLDVSRIENGKLTLHREDCELGELTAQVLETFSPSFQAVGTLVAMKIEKDLVGNWDRYRIEQVIANLLTNAIKYAQGKPVQVSVSRRNNMAVLKVKDHGIGIAEKDQVKIFQRFERAVSPDNISGLGLGLYITKQILDMHNGGITVKSEVAKGATFTVELPLLNAGTLA